MSEFQSARQLNGSPKLSHNGRWHSRTQPDPDSAVKTRWAGGDPDTPPTTADRPPSTQPVSRESFSRLIPGSTSPVLLSRAARTRPPHGVRSLGTGVYVRVSTPHGWSTGAYDSSKTAAEVRGTQTSKLKLEFGSGLLTCPAGRISTTVCVPQ